eukprot:augustus_masked-scaffold_13-processed-gene-6.10-mRNA-1 protein AED:1.00 eAED:1.00 QI:0/0/0/0/1/1/3/0/312
MEVGLQKDRSFVLSPLLQTAQIVSVSLSDPKIDLSDNLKEDCSLFGASFIGLSPDARKAFFSKKKNFKGLSFRKDLFYSFDFYNDKLDLENYKLHAAKMQFDLMSYLNSQPISFLAKVRRMKAMESSEPLLRAQTPDLHERVVFLEKKIRRFETAIILLTIVCLDYPDTRASRADFHYLRGDGFGDHEEGEIVENGKRHKFPFDRHDHHHHGERDRRHRHEHEHHRREHNHDHEDHEKRHHEHDNHDGRHHRRRVVEDQGQDEVLVGRRLQELKPVFPVNGRMPVLKAGGKMEKYDPIVIVDDFGPEGKPQK